MLMSLKTARLWSTVAAALLIAGAVSAAGIVGKDQGGVSLNSVQMSAAI